jgi:uncharacterized protein YggE
MKPVIATLALLFTTSLASANVTVSGTGKVSYAPDIGYVSVGISSDGATATEAWQKNSAIVKKVFEGLKALGLDPKDYHTSGLNLTPRYVTPNDKEPVLVGYTASYDLNVTVRNLAEIGKVLDRLVENGANRRMSIGMGCADPEKLLDQARQQAVLEARKKAQIYVTAAGGSLGPVVEITDGQNVPQRSFEYLHSASAKDTALIIAAGQQELTVTVTATFTINQSAAGPRS